MQRGGHRRADRLARPEPPASPRIHSWPGQVLAASPAEQVRRSRRSGFLCTESPSRLRVSCRDCSTSSFARHLGSHHGCLRMNRQALAAFLTLRTARERRISLARAHISFATTSPGARGRAQRLRWSNDTVDARDRTCVMQLVSRMGGAVSRPGEPYLPAGGRQRNSIKGAAISTKRS